MVSFGAALPAAHCCLKVGPLGPADGAAEGAELGCGAPGTTQGFTAGLDVLDHVNYQLWRHTKLANEYVTPAVPHCV